MYSSRGTDAPRSQRERGPLRNQRRPKSDPRATQGRPAHWICPVPGRSRACTQGFSSIDSVPWFMRPCLPCALIPKENEHPERTGRNFKGHSEEHPLWSSLISRPSASPRGPFGNFLGLQPPGRQKQKIGDGSPKRGGRFVQQSGHRRAPLPEGTGPAEKPAATQERPKGDPGATRALDLRTASQETKLPPGQSLGGQTSGLVRCRFSNRRWSCASRQAKNGSSSRVGVARRTMRPCIVVPRIYILVACSWASSFRILGCREMGRPTGLFPDLSHHVTLPWELDGSLIGTGCRHAGWGVMFCESSAPLCPASLAQAPCLRVLGACQFKNWPAFPGSGNRKLPFVCHSPRSHFGSALLGKNPSAHADRTLPCWLAYMIPAAGIFMHRCLGMTGLESERPGLHEKCQWKSRGRSIDLPRPPVRPCVQVATGGQSIIWTVFQCCPGWCEASASPGACKTLRHGSADSCAAGAFK